MTHTKILGKTYREHIGGRWAISWIVFALNVPVNILAILTSIRVEPVGVQWWGWMGVALIGVAAIALVFILADVTILRHRRVIPVAVWVVALVGLIAGVVRGASVVTASSALGLQPFTPTDLINRMVAGGVVGAVALPLAALALSILFTYRSERQRLVETAIDIERDRLNQEGQIDTLRRTLLVGVKEEVAAALSSVSLDDPRAVSEVMRETSHRIWMQDEPVSGVRQVRVRSILWSAIRSRPLPVWPVVALWGVTAAGTLIAAIGPVRGVSNLVFSLVAIWLTLSLANRWIRAFPSQWILATVVMVTVAYLITSPVSYLLFDPRPLTAAAPLMVVNSVWLPICVVLVALFSSAIASGEQVLQQLAESVNSAEIGRRALEAERDEMLKEIAAQLHGTAHSPLVAGSALLAGGDDEIERQRLLEYVGSAVAQLELRDPSASLAHRLASLASHWEGLVDVRIVVHPDAESSLRADSSRRVVERIVEEGIANAYRHGGASKVDVEVSGHPGGLAIRLIDNGSGIPEGRGDGLGSRLFSAASATWSIRNRDAGGAELSVNLPL